MDEHGTCQFRKPLFLFSPRKILLIKCKKFLQVNNIFKLK
ncbi:hypothetical protein BN2497_13865 [Janthinobacterium sp. CG23_2]|nr:hypothetical protein BN2497_13865 [Janthinobacterium sp. CG23_2]CUU33330.1 hypothetical protein BN3177_13865 [Janthinobacterium sp. CG23_2]